MSRLPEKPVTEKPVPGNDEVDRDSEESFPASDPPSWTPVVGDGKPPPDRKPD